MSLDADPYQSKTVVRCIHIDVVPRFNYQPAVLYGDIIERVLARQRAIPHR